MVSTSSGKGFHYCINVPYFHASVTVSAWYAWLTSSSSTLTFRKVTVGYLDDSSANLGAIILHGPHHCGQDVIRS